MAKRAKKIRILLTGGGTGGHIYPLISVALELRKNLMNQGFNPDIRYFGDPGNFKFYLDSSGIRIAKIVSSKWRRYLSIKNFFDIFRFLFGFMQSLWKVYWFMPDLCFSKGGPGSLPVIYICRFYAVPLVIHESDAVPGLTTKLSARKARLVELAFESAKDYFNTSAGIKVVGNPVREEILSAEGLKDVEYEFGFSPKEPVIFFIGGSQGASKLNEFVFENIQKLIENFQVLHQVGWDNFPGYKREFDFLYKDASGYLKSRYYFAPYFEKNIGMVYQAADIVVARAGANSIFELAALGKPSILVPLSESANNHQVENAYYYEKKGATLVIEEENLLGSLLINEVNKLLADKDRYELMSQAARNFYIPDTAKLISNDILEVISITPQAKEPEYTREEIGAEKDEA